MTERTIPQLVAHRGYLLHYPENTWPGLEAALKAGACWLEFDIQMCADRTFILLHDADFNRTAHRVQSVFETQSGDIKSISVHEPDRLGEQFAPVIAPALTDVMTRLTDFPAARIMVEIKEESLEHWGLETVMDTLLQSLQPFHAQCVLISFSHDALGYAMQHSALRTGWVLQQYDKAHWQRAQSLNPDFLICNHTKISEQEPLWTGAWQWMLYDITDPSLALDWAARGAALIETADIGSMLRDPVLAQRKCRHGL